MLAPSYRGVAAAKIVEPVAEGAGVCSVNGKPKATADPSLKQIEAYHASLFNMGLSMRSVWGPLLPSFRITTATREATRMLLEKMFDPLVKERPICVTARAVLERLFNAERIDALFQRVAERMKRGHARASASSACGLSAA